MCQIAEADAADVEKVVKAACAGPGVAHPDQFHGSEDSGQGRVRDASDGAKRHGLYFELTYKANGKTVNVKLSPQAAPLYRAAAQQYRKLKSLLNRLDKFSKTILRQEAKRAESNPQD